jgi:tetratricopeptide (TPR) repeat protein
LKGEDTQDDPATFASVRLVLTAAHRHGAHDHARTVDLNAIADIARIVQGVPLALELAASWLRFMTPAEIALELRRSWELLEDTTLQLPDRQSGLKAVFDSTWALMPSEQQRVLARLAIFEGDFDFAAAKAVAGSDHRSIHRVMLQLMDWALLQRLDHGRFDLHPLIREYARQYLGDAKIVMNALKEHFLSLTQRSHQLLPDALDKDIENVFLVWKTALNDHDQPTLEVLASPFFEVLFRLGRLLELRAQLEMAFKTTPQPRLQHILHAWQIEMHHHLRSTIKPNLEPEQLLPHLEREGLLFELAFTHHNMGLADFEAQRYPQALEHFEASLKHGRQIPYPYWDIVVLSNTALLYQRQGNQSAARRILQDLLETAVVQSDYNSLASVNNLIGELEYANRHWENAKAHFVKAEHLARISKTTRVHALTLENLGWVAVQHVNTAQAAQDFSSALQQFRASGDMIGVGHAYCSLAHAQQLNQQLEDARLNRLKGLRIAQEVNAAVIVSKCLQHWLPVLQFEQPQLASAVRTHIDTGDRVLAHLPALIAFLEQSSSNVMS